MFCVDGRGKSEVARLLLEEGAEASLRNSSGCSALVIASGEGHMDVVKELVSWAGFCLSSG